MPDKRVESFTQSLWEFDTESNNVNVSGHDILTNPLQADILNPATPVICPFGNLILGWRRRILLSPRLAPDLYRDDTHEGGSDDGSLDTERNASSVVSNPFELEVDNTEAT